MNVASRLFELKNDEYKEFQSKLVPNIDKDIILGVKTPDLRKIAKEVFESEDKNLFLNSLPHKYYEENLIHFFVIGMHKSFDETIKLVETFLSYVDCWPVSDQTSPKAFKKNHQLLLPYVKKWIESELDLEYVC